ncbi:hypothetical protein HYPSUDRAFT_42953 [Hypholoma sublateritium FD-334 SS-4]|uniref:Uncharacterized protein n=1 Tax=Hypholoma sublateritium (strain FD-334 SS-4) TaxID=945553 RepID=A0A0D2L1V1_HYPSF|nr:hypothetical protein HYPSUDRAFT_42953 [Hypholoma sublateritium FD-334 SS-4]
MADLRPKFVMNSSQNHEIFGYNNANRPEYPTPPFLERRDQMHGGHFYGSTTVNPSSIHSDFRIASELSHYNNSLSPSPLSDGTNSVGPLSLEDTPTPLQDDVVSISTSFHPQNQPTPETVLVSSDNVLFYIHSPTLLAACPDVFTAYVNTSLSRDEYRTMAVHLDATATQLNIILHTLHGTSPAANNPDFDTLVTSIDRMPSFGMSPPRFIRPTAPIHELLLSYAPLRPLDLYALGAHHNISSLAVTSSSHLLSCNLSTITDPIAERIGAVYLKKLMLLHADRNMALRNILLHSPHPHPPTKTCSFEDQKSLTRAWALVSAYLVWDAKPDISTFAIKATLNPLLENMTCKLCHQALQARIKDVVSQWASGKHTI